MNKKTLLIVLSLFYTAMIFAQNDSLILNNGDKIIGEIKAMNRGVVSIETDYSDSDFKVEWDGIKELYTISSFLITLSDGTRLNGKIESSAPGKVILITEDEGTVETEFDNIVFLKSVDKGFWDQVYASIDIGFDLTKANNLRQFSTRSTLGYLAERWSADATYNTLNSVQDDVDPIHRTDAGLAFKYYLPKDWYIPTSISFLSNTEQKLDLRTVGKLGIGKYIIHTNHTYWGFEGGGSYNNENYWEDVDDKSSWEAYFGTELNMFDIGDLSLLTKAMAYPSITESGRWRADFNFDLNYDLPMDFYIKLGFTVNYDNRPVEGASETDYVLHTGFGWSW